MLEVILKRFENPDEVRLFEKGKFEIVFSPESGAEPTRWTVYDFEVLKTLEIRFNCRLEE